MDDNLTAEQMDDFLVAKGYAPNDFILDLNGALQVGYDVELPAPWNLPSRLFRFPVAVSRPGRSGVPRQLRLTHPLLARHPFVIRLEQDLGRPIDTFGSADGDDPSGKAKLGVWWHAVDLVCAGKLEGLLETREFTNDTSIVRALEFGLQYGHLGVSQARSTLKKMNLTLPTGSSSLAPHFRRPSPIKSEKGATRYPINCSGQSTDEARLAAMIHGIDAGLFIMKQGGHLQWSPLGLERYAMEGSKGPEPEKLVYVESSGQAAFAF